MEPTNTDNELCPITLEPLRDKPPLQVFVHRGTGFDIEALYHYLTVSPSMTNPLNRIPFTCEDLVRLETQMKEVYGTDCIIPYSPNASTPSSPTHDDSISDTVDWFSDAELQSRVTTQVVGSSASVGVSASATIRLRVDIDVTETDVEELPGYDSIEEMKLVPEADEICDWDDFPLSSYELPPTRVFPSVVEMYADRGRERRMQDRLCLLQYLEYEAMHTLRTLLDLSNDHNFHRHVWEQTSLSVMDTVSQHLTPTNASDTPDSAGITEQVFHHTAPDVELDERAATTDAAADYNLEVVYTECWEIYRLIVIHTLQRKYTETARDIANLGRTELQALVSCHRHQVQQEVERTGHSYESILGLLHTVEEMYS